jgi:hypothetical protein
VPVPYFLLFLCFRKATQEIFLKLKETKAEPPIFPEHESESKAETEGGQDLATPCRRGESPPEAFFITMVASRVMCE